MTKTYGMPHVVSACELFYFNNGNGKLRIKFDGGVPDEKINIPATYSTSNEFEQIVIEQSPRFGKTVFRYNGKGNIIDMDMLLKEDEAIKEATKNKKVSAPSSKKSSPANASVYEEVETLGQATEVLLELGCSAGELGGPDAILTAMKVYRVSFPNLKIK